MLVRIFRKKHNWEFLGLLYPCNKKKKRIFIQIILRHISHQLREVHFKGLRNVSSFPFLLSYICCFVVQTREFRKLFSLIPSIQTKQDTQQRKLKITQKEPASNVCVYINIQISTMIQCSQFPFLVRTSWLRAQKEKKRKTRLKKKNMNKEPEIMIY